MRSLITSAIVFSMFVGLVYFGYTLQPMLKMIGTVHEFRAQATITIFMVLMTSILITAHRLIPARA